MTQSESDTNETLREMERLHEREKTLIGYDLHDGIAQWVIGAKMNLDAMSRKGISEKDCQKVDDARQYLSDTIVDLRRMVSDLRASSIEPESIALELEFLNVRYRCAELAIDFFTEDNLAELPSSICGAVYRITQESLNNIKKHSQANAVKVILSRSDVRWQLSVLDNGIGIENRQSGANPDGQGFGLPGIWFRAAATGGTVKLFSKAISETTEVIRPNQVEKLNSIEQRISEQRSSERLPRKLMNETIIYPVEQWLNESENSMQQEQIGPNFVCGTLVNVEWPISE